MPRQQARPQDYTGRVRDEGAKKRDAEAKRANEISMATAEAEAAELDEVIDLTAPPAAAEVETGPVEVLPATRKVTMNQTLEQTTYGHGNTATLEEGRTYVLKREWADHLDRLGFVHH